MNLCRSSAPYRGRSQFPGRTLRSLHRARAETPSPRSHDRIDPVHMGERTPADMMIDANQETIFETLQGGWIDLSHSRMIAGVASDNRDRTAQLHRRMEANGRCGNASVKHNVGVLPHRAQNLAAGEGSNPRRRHPAGHAMSARNVQCCPICRRHLEHVARPSRHGAPSGSRPLPGPLQQFFHSALSCSARSKRKYSSGARRNFNRSTSS